MLKNDTAELFATENMKLGKKGVFFSLEVDKRRLAKRLYSSLLLKSGLDLMNTTKEQAEAVFADYGEGDIKIKKMEYIIIGTRQSDFPICINTC